jgi:hypothetical protein
VRRPLRFSRYVLRRGGRLSNHMNRPTFQLTIRSEPPREWPTSQYVRLRGLLKDMLRRWGFRCVDAKEETQEGCPPLELDIEDLF